MLGAFLHDVIARLKAVADLFPRLDLAYSHEQPTTSPILLNLPENGLRLRFDGPEQRLRLIEILDFTKSKLTYRDREVFKSTSTETEHLNGDELAGPTFRHIYNRLLGPTFPGEYIAPEDGEESGVYVLSYPGVAFSFPIPASLWSPNKDPVSLLSSSTSAPAQSMVVFSGESWPSARKELFTTALDPVRDAPHASKFKESIPDEISLVKIHGGGKIELVRSWQQESFWIYIGETTPQSLVAELGPPDAIYRKNDQPMSIHKARPLSETRTRAEVHEIRRRLQDDMDTDHSSANTTTDDSGDDSGDIETPSRSSEDCFYNYFYHGFDVLVSTTANPSPCPPSTSEQSSASSTRITASHATPCSVVAKLILHGNAPGSYPFNRHRRCRWEIAYLPDNHQQSNNSECTFEHIEEQLRDKWAAIYSNPTEAKQRQRGMVLNRDWGDSPGNSCELLGGWEDGVRTAQGDGNQEGGGLGNTTLFGFPGLVFEVLGNGSISALTVF